MTAATMSTATADAGEQQTQPQSPSSSQSYRVLALYKFVTPPLPKDQLKTIQAALDAKCRSHKCRGTLLLAEEGINGTICYPHDAVDDGHSNNSNEDHDDVLRYIQSIVNGGLRIRISIAPYPVFTRLKIKVKQEIVSMHRQDLCCPTTRVGTYVPPSRWNDLLLDPDCLVIDTRNDYEVQVGTFRNAVNPNTYSFTEFPEWMQQRLQGDASPQKIAMFCTGGIRCEKATSACMQLVSNHKDTPVYHLEGGILAYLDEIPQESSLFDGECYVFDQRIAVTHGLHPSTTYTSSCYACRHPLSTQDLKREDYLKGLQCRYCVDELTEKQKERFESRQRQIELASQRGEVHIYDPKELVAT